MKNKKHFNKIKAKILRVLFQQKMSLSIYEVAKECDISYPTAKKYLEQLTKEGIINESEHIKKEYIEKENKITQN